MWWDHLFDRMAKQSKNSLGNSFLSLLFPVPEVEDVEAFGVTTHTAFVQWDFYFSHRADEAESSMYIIIIRSPVATIGLLYLSILLREEQPGKLKPRAVAVDPEAIGVSFRGHWNPCT